MGLVNFSRRHRSRSRHTVPGTDVSANDTLGAVIKSATAVVAGPAAPVIPLPSQNRVDRVVLPHATSSSQQDGERYLEVDTSLQEGTSNPWSAAYSQAFAELDSADQDIVGQSRDVEALFDTLVEVNLEHKDHSLLRRGLDRMQKPAQYLDAAFKLAAPAAGTSATASAAVGVVRAVVTLAVGVCGFEERLGKYVGRMVERISIIGECNTLGQKFHNNRIHRALLLVYKDLLKFYCTVTKLLSKKFTTVAWLSEQFIEEIPPVVDDFMNHASQLQSHISNATSETVKSIESMLIDSKIQQLLGAQKLDKLDRLHLELSRKTAKNACQWVTEDAAFRTWYSTTPDQPLVLFGDMGSGKTIIMSFLIDEIRQLSKVQIPCALSCYHYCQDDETGQPLYIYSSLVQQLMRQNPQIKLQFSHWCDKEGSKGVVGPTQDSKLLAKFFFDSIQKLGRPVFVFLDGLDECSDEACEELVSDFKENSSSVPGLRVCLSSRYNEEIRDLLKGSQEVRILKSLERDTVIATYLTENRLKFLKSENKSLVVDKISQLAEGSAIWVTKAVDLLATRKISAPAKLRHFLQVDLPRFTLSDLYASLFSHVTGDDIENKRLLSTGLEMLACSARTLSILEISWAVTLREEGQVTAVKDLGDYVDSRRLLGLLAPFIGSVDYEDQKGRQVHLIHQSVRELTLKCTPSQWMVEKAPYSPLPSPMRASTDVVPRQLEIHGNIMQLCMRYLLMDDLANLKLLSAEQDNLRIFQEAMPGILNDDEDEDDQIQRGKDENIFCDPSERGFGEFFVYASCYWLYRMRRADEHAKPDLSQLIMLTTGGNTRVNNWWDQFHRPDCIFQRGDDLKRSRPVDPLTITALHGSESLLREVLAQKHMSNNLKQAVGAILREHGDIHRLPILTPFKHGEDVGETMQLFFKILRDWANREYAGAQAQFEVVFDHIAAAADIMVEQGWGNELLCCVASNGCLPLATRLFKAAATNPALKLELLRTPDRDTPGTARHQSIGEAAWEGHKDMIAFLLQQDGIDAHLCYRNLGGNNVLHLATRRCDVETFKLLLSRFPQGSGQERSDGETPLRLVLFDRKQPDDADLVEALLQVGNVDVRCGFTEQPSSWEEPIRMAVRYCDVRMCQVLVTAGGVDPMSVFAQREDGTVEFIDKLDHPDRMEQVRDTLLTLAEEIKAQRALDGA